MSGRSTSHQSHKYSIPCWEACQQLCHQSAKSEFLVHIHQGQQDDREEAVIIVVCAPMLGRLLDAQFITLWTAEQWPSSLPLSKAVASTCPWACWPGPEGSRWQSHQYCCTQWRLGYSLLSLSVSSSSSNRCVATEKSWRLGVWSNIEGQDKLRWVLRNETEINADDMAK